MLTLSKTVGTTQLDTLNKPHSLSDEMFQTSTQLDKHNKPSLKIDQQSLHTIYKAIRTPPHEATRQTRPTGKASRQLDKVNKRILSNTVNSANDQLNKLHRLY